MDLRFGWQVLLGSADYSVLGLLPVLQITPLYGSDDFADLSIFKLDQLLALRDHFQPRRVLCFVLGDLVADRSTLLILQAVIN